MNNLLKLKSTTAPIAVGLALLATPSFAQETAADTSADQVIVVTGTRIARPDLQSNSPVAFISSADIERRADITPEAVLNTLPQFVPFTTAASNNPGGGQANVDLRGLGTSRTLVLVNGRRFVGSGQDQVVDLNTLPTDLIERVDVVTGGASAVYGSDAMAGVVNFVMKDNFEGLKIRSTAGVTEKGDGAEYSISGLLGSNLADDRGNITIFGGWAKRNGIFANARDFTKIDQTGLADVAQFANGTFVQGGSSRGVTGSIVSNPANPTPRVPYDANQLLTNGQACGPFLIGAVGALEEGNRTISFAPDGSPRGFCTVADTFGGDRYDFASTNYIQIPSERYNASAFAHYDVTDSITAFAEFTYAHVSAKNQLAPSPLAASEGVTIAANSSLLTAETQAILAGRADPTAPATVERRMWELGARVQDFRTNLFQGLFGLRGDLTENIKFNVYGSYGRTEITTETLNDLSTSRLQAALNGCPAGAPAGCAAAGDWSNFFGGELTQSQVNYLVYPTLTDRLTVDRKLVSADISGTLADLPAGPLGFALGVEYRKESSTSTPDAAKQADDIVGFNAALPISGSYDVKEIFGELAVPLLADKPFAHELSLEFGGRISDYSTVGTVYTFKAGGTYAPVAGLRLRGLYQRATRAPNVFELYRAADQDFPVVFDPCDSRFFEADAAVETRCLASGVDPASFVATNLQVEATRVGNTSLKEEKADTYTIGLVASGRDLAPGSFLSRFTATVDYYNITIKNAILSEYAGAQSLVNACYLNGDTAACDHLSRSPAGDTIIDTISFENLAKYKVSGIDFTLDYRQPIGNVTFGLNTNVGYLIHYTISDVIRGTADGAGYNSDFGFLPHWKATTRASLGFGSANVDLTWRFIGGYKGSFSKFDPIDDANSGSGFAVAYPDYKVGSKSYFDLGIGFKLPSDFSLDIAVLNLANTKPIPLYDLSEQSNTSPSNYDLLGRSFRLSVSKKF